MSNRLPIPPELQHLIEKREAPDRRKEPRRAGEDPQRSQPGDESARANSDQPLQGDSAELPAQQDRRMTGDRRRNTRRQDEK